MSWSKVGCLHNIESIPLSNLKTKKQQKANKTKLKQQQHKNNQPKKQKTL